MRLHRLRAESSFRRHIFLLRRWTAGRRIKLRDYAFASSIKALVGWGATQLRDFQNVSTLLRAIAAPSQPESS
jgi:hypothetical protein